MRLLYHHTDICHNACSIPITKFLTQIMDHLIIFRVWNDKASRPGFINCIINDIDLTLIQGDKIYQPNGQSFPHRINNAERIIVSANSSEEFEIVVKAHNIAKYRQSYALVITGCFNHDNVTSLTTKSSKTDLNLQDGTHSAANNVSESGNKPNEETPIAPWQNSSSHPHSSFLISLAILLVSILLFSSYCLEVCIICC